MILVLSGGVGGARLCAGLVHAFAPHEMLVAVNTGDDFDHWGLRICPDLDTVMYTLSGRVDEAQGWGLAGDTWQTLDAVRRAGGPDWFRLGDEDLRTHLARTALLSAGHTLSQATHALFHSAGLRHAVTPVTDEAHRTVVETDRGSLDFQDYFVRLRAEPRLRAIRCGSGQPPSPAPALAAAMASGDVKAVIICPSNPVLSVQPILAVAGLRSWLERRSFPVLAVSPFIGSNVIKGPAAKIFGELGLAPTVSGLARWYDGLVDGWLIDSRDAACPVPAGVRLRTHHILLDTHERRREVASQLRNWLADW